MTIQHSIARWSEIFGLEIVDWDGFRGMNEGTKVDFDTYMKEVCECTINPINWQRYAIFDELTRVGS